MNEFLIVGGGLAGAILATEAKARELNFRWIISEKIPAASFAAYGICNPVQFRNKVPAWKADEFYQLSKSFFLNYENQLGMELLKEMPIHHLVVDSDELILWRQNVESTTLWKYTSGEPHLELLPYLHRTYCGTIFIKQAFYVSIPSFVLAVREYLKEHINWTDFDPALLKETEKGWKYKNETYKQIIFAEGVHGYSNPFFKQIPFNPCKGEILVLSIPGFPIIEAIHKKIVLIPQGEHVFICGATYFWDDLSFNPSDMGRMELEQAIDEILGDRYSYEILDHRAGVRPSISDRRPVVGWHPKYMDIGILNGFGSMGLMVGPAAAKNLLDNLQTGNAILPDWDINRFKKRLLKK